MPEVKLLPKRCDECKYSSSGSLTKVVCAYFSKVEVPMPFHTSGPAMVVVEKTDGGNCKCFKPRQEF